MKEYNENKDQRDVIRSIVLRMRSLHPTPPTQEEMLCLCQGTGNPGATLGMIGRLLGIPQNYLLNTKGCPKGEFYKQWISSNYRIPAFVAGTGSHVWCYIAKEQGTNLVQLNDSKVLSTTLEGAIAPIYQPKPGDRNGTLGNGEILYRMCDRDESL